MSPARTDGDKSLTSLTKTDAWTWLAGTHTKAAPPAARVTIASTTFQVVVIARTIPIRRRSTPAHFLALLIPGVDFLRIARTAMTCGWHNATDACLGIAAVKGVFIAAAFLRSRARIDLDQVASTQRTTWLTRIAGCFPRPVRRRHDRLPRNAAPGIAPARGG